MKELTHKEISAKGGRAGKGKSKVRGDSEYYRRIRKNKGNRELVAKRKDRKANDHAHAAREAGSRGATC